MCCLTPLVIVSAGQTTCEEYNISLRNVREFMDGGLVKTLHEVGNIFMLISYAICHTLLLSFYANLLYHTLLLSFYANLLLYYCLLTILSCSIIVFLPPMHP
jgi:hypothetical protein